MKIRKMLSTILVAVTTAQCMMFTVPAKEVGKDEVHLNSTTDDVVEQTANNIETEPDVLTFASDENYDAINNDAVNAHDISSRNMLIENTNDIGVNVDNSKKDDHENSSVTISLETGISYAEKQSYTDHEYSVKIDVYENTAYTLQTASVEGYVYSASSDGTATIIGYRGSETELVIPESIDGYSITKIGNGAFETAKNFV